MKIHIYNQTGVLFLKEVDSTTKITQEEEKQMESFSKMEVESIFTEFLPGVVLGQLDDQSDYTNPKFAKQVNVKLK